MPPCGGQRIACSVWPRCTYARRAEGCRRFGQHPGIIGVCRAVGGGSGRAQDVDGGGGRDAAAARLAAAAAALAAAAAEHGRAAGGGSPKVRARNRELQRAVRPQRGGAGGLQQQRGGHHCHEQRPEAAAHLSASLRWPWTRRRTRSDSAQRAVDSIGPKARPGFSRSNQDDLDLRMRGWFSAATEFGCACRYGSAGVLEAMR